MLRRRIPRPLKLIGIGLLSSTILVLVAAFAVAQPHISQVGQESSLTPTAARASQAAAALADAHPGNRAVSILAGLAQREAARVSTEGHPNTEQRLTAFATQAEEHLVSANRNPAQAQQLLRGLVQELRSSPSSTPAPSVALDQPSEKLSAFGRDITVEAGTTVEEASVVGGNLIVRGHVIGDAIAVGGNVQLIEGSRVDGDIVSVGGNVLLENSARGEGDIVSVGGHTSVADGAWVGGDRIQVGPGTWTQALPFSHTEESGSWFGAWVGSVVETIGLGLVMILLGIIIAALAPNRVRNIIATTRRRPVMSLVSGILAAIVTVTASILLAITLVGIPVALILLFGGALATVIGITGVACLIGEVLPGKGRKQRSAMRCIVLGMIVLTVVSLLPLGTLILMIVVSMSLGSVILSKIGATEPHS